MRLSEMALEELGGPIAMLTGLFFVRLVRMDTKYNSAVFAVFGVPPWRSLVSRDCYRKKVFQVF